MKLRIVTIAERGVPNNERLHLKVTEATNLSSHIVLSSVFASLVTVANGSKPSFWFPPQAVKPNDDIVLYTRAGVPEPPRLQPSGNMTYFYFWGLDNTLWDNPSSCALAFEVAGWSASTNPEAEKLAADYNLGNWAYPQANTLGELLKQSESNALLAALKSGGSANSLSSQNSLNSLGEAFRLASGPSEQGNTLAEAIKRYGMAGTHNLLNPDDDDDKPSNPFLP